MKKQFFTSLAIALVATSSVFAQLSVPTDSGTINSLVYLQFEDGVIIPEGVTGVTNIDGKDSTYIKTGTTTVGQEANRIEVDGEENVLWMDYDGCIKFDSTLINKDHFSVSFDMKWSGANNVWYLGLWGVIGFDNNRTVVTDGDTVLTPGYVTRQFQFGNTSQHELQGFGSNFPARDEWEHIVFTVDSGVAYLYRADSLSAENMTMFEIIPELSQPEFYLGIKATVDPETGVVTPGRATNANADCKETQMSLDNVALFDVALTAEQVAIIYNGEEEAAISENNTVELTVYPNPVEDQMNFSNADVASVALYSITGKQLLNSAVSNGQVDMSQMNSGLYLVRAYSQEGNLINTIKVMKK